MKEQLILGDITFTYFYTFPLESDLSPQILVEKLYTDAVAKACTWDGGKQCRSKTDSNPRLNQIVRFLRTYFNPAYLGLERACYCELEDIRLETPTSEANSVGVLLGVHEAGAACLTFIIENVPTLTLSQFWELLFIDQQEQDFDLQQLSNFLQSRAHATLTQYKIRCDLGKLASLIIDALRQAIAPSSTKSHQGDFPLPPRQSSNYSAVFISDLGSQYDAPEEFISLHKSEVFNMTAARYHYKSYDFASTRRDEYTDSVLRSQGSSRRHVCYFISPERMLALSTMKYHKQLYPYEYDWYMSYICMLSVAMLQWELLTEMNDKLLRWKADDPYQVSQFKKVISQGLEEYHNMTVVSDYRARAFMSNAKQALGMDGLLESVNQKLSLVSDYVTEEHDFRVEKRTLATEAAINVLSLIVAAGVVVEVVDKFFPDASWIWYLLGWIAVVAAFIGIYQIVAKLRRKRK